MRHIREKHRKCNNIKLIFKNRISSKMMDISNSLSQLNKITEISEDAMRSPVTPVTSELNQFENNWMPFQPLANNVGGSAKGSTASTCLYSDLEELVWSGPR